MDSKLRVVSKEKDQMTLEMTNYDNTILKPLVEEILKDEQVAESKYYLKHPTIDNPLIYVRVKTGKPQAAVKRAIRKMSKVYETLSADLARELKKSKNVE
ncbi:MAG: DNA-directed RNA polymerase subunit L [Candidatus Thermoplasmatota archaeon]|nr:DNA-directed RNA polymerase subunit L [Candidatus Thermoplasmatota archaeon]MCL5437882.1 DNA-directed RNA polymerase subunit L [Candidatus Thermoplasmatota archaeon]